jgi:hypothetical protein
MGFNARSNFNILKVDSIDCKAIGYLNLSSIKNFVLPADRFLDLIKSLTWTDTTIDLVYQDESAFETDWNNTEYGDKYLKFNKKYIEFLNTSINYCTVQASEDLPPVYTYTLEPENGQLFFDDMATFEKDIWMDFGLEDSSVVKILDTNTYLFINKEYGSIDNITNLDYLYMPEEFYPFYRFSPQWSSYYAKLTEDKIKQY